MSVSIFGRILLPLIERLPGARAAVMVDADGYTVDACFHPVHAPHLSIADNLELVGAQWAATYRHATHAFERLGLGIPSELCLSGDRERVVMQAIRPDLFVALTLETTSNLPLARRALAGVHADLVREL